MGDTSVSMGNNSFHAGLNMGIAKSIHYDTLETHFLLKNLNPRISISLVLDFAPEQTLQAESLVILLSTQKHGSNISLRCF